MRTFRLVVAYDGAAFSGWQRQPERRTVQGVLEAALSEVLQETVRITGAGRTDAGVHARGQVASFASPTRLPASALAPLLNRALPEDVRVRAAAEARPGFDARHDAVARRYVYRLLREEDVLFRRVAWCPRRPVEVAALASAMGPLEGRHDFTSFRGAGSSPVTPECTMVRARVEAWEGGARLELVADHFLYHMVRNIVGTALDAAGTPDPAAAMGAVLAARERARGGATVPPQGLTLEQVFYPGEEP